MHDVACSSGSSGSVTEQAPRLAGAGRGGLDGACLAAVSGHAGGEAFEAMAASRRGQAAWMGLHPRRQGSSAVARHGRVVGARPVQGFHGSTLTGRFRGSTQPVATRGFQLCNESFHGSKLTDRHSGGWQLSVLCNERGIAEGGCVGGLYPHLCRALQSLAARRHDTAVSVVTHRSCKAGGVWAGRCGALETPRRRRGCRRGRAGRWTRTCAGCAALMIARLAMAPPRRSGAPRTMPALLYSARAGAGSAGSAHVRRRRSSGERNATAPDCVALPDTAGRATRMVGESRRTVRRPRPESAASRGPEGTARRGRWTGLCRRDGPGPALRRGRRVLPLTSAMGRRRRRPGCASSHPGRTR